ncbi:MAG: hypothetical protein JXQ83_11905 [Candidatus Glassbacteria bacterium]|nr:hypothetical protein [Candidatus Glassbacteria bacterium]
MPGRTIVFSLLLVLAAYGPVLARREFPPSVYDSTARRSVFIFTDQLNSSLSEAEARFSASHYVGTQKVPRSIIDKIRAYNENFIHLHYKLAITVDSIANYGLIIGGDWHSNNRDSISNWGQVRSHPDWFLLNASGGWTVHGGRRMVMDIANPEFREWWVSSCISEMEANSCDGVFADTYTVAAISFRTTFPELFDNVERMVNEWVPELNEYGQYVYERLEEAGYYFFPNIDNLQTTWANNAGTHYSKGDYLHGAMLESFGNWSSAGDAIAAITMFKNIQKKGVFLHGQGYINGSGDMNASLTTPQKRMWMVGLYLLTNNGRFYLSIYDGASSQLGAGSRALWYPEYELDLGPYLAEWDNLYNLRWEGVYRRDYEKGFVLVNFNDYPKTVDLGGTCYLAEDDSSTTRYWADYNTGEEEVSLKYTAVSSLTMPKLSAAVLLEEPGEGAGCLMEPKGDFNGDGKLGMSDVIKMILEMNAGSEDLCLDFNGDGQQSIADAVALIIYIFHS